MRKRFSDQELTPARLRMARIPKGAALIDNVLSRAPGFMLENVIVMAGVPRIMQVMLDAVAPRLAKGRPMLSRSVRVDVPEGDVAQGLAELQLAHPDVQIGSYPFFENKRLGTYVVLRGIDVETLAAAENALWIFIRRERFAAAAADGCLKDFSKKRISRALLRCETSRDAGAHAASRARLVSGDPRAVATRTTAAIASPSDRVARSSRDARSCARESIERCNASERGEDRGEARCAPRDARKRLAAGPIKVRVRRSN